MSDIKIIVPDMGDFKDVEIIEVLVKEGQTINKNDSLITLESDKSSVEVPSTESGTINKINVKVGDKVNQGDLILTLNSSEKVEQLKEPVAETPAKRVDVEKDQPRKIKTPPPAAVKTSKTVTKLASPKVRKFARELGANILEISGSQRSGRVSEDDVKEFVRSQVTVNKGAVEKKD